MLVKFVYTLLKVSILFLKDVFTPLKIAVFLNLLLSKDFLPPYNMGDLPIFS